MSLYRLVSGKVLKGRKNEADYLEADLDFLSNVCENMSFNYEETLELGYSGVEKVKSGENLSEDEARVLAAVFVGDADWQGAWCTWINNTYIRELALLSAGHVRNTWKSVAENYYDLRKLGEPQYSRPSFFKTNGKTCLEQTSSTEEAIMMKTGVLQLDWFEYVCRQTQIEHDEELFQKAREETAHYYSGETDDFSPKVKELQHHMFRNDIKWFEKLNQELGVKSYSIERAHRIYQKHLDEELNLH